MILVRQKQRPHIKKDAIFFFIKQYTLIITESATIVWRLREDGREAAGNIGRRNKLDVARKALAAFPGFGQEVEF